MGPRGHFLTLAAGLLACALSPSLASADHACTAPPDILRLAQPLTHAAARLAKHEPLTIVAVGSSSTFGAGASSPAASYPSRLAVDLKTLFPKEMITVVNRGVNGEEVTDMLRRFADGVLKEKPDLVLWQVGTNSVLRDKPLGPHSPLLLDGIRRLKAAGADVVLIDPQYVPRVIAKADAEGMVRLIATTAKRQDDVDLEIQRFAVMRWWHRPRAHGFRRVRLARQSAHERLGLRLPRQADQRRDQRGGDAQRDVRVGPCRDAGQRDAVSRDRSHPRFSVRQRRPLGPACWAPMLIPGGRLVGRSPWPGCCGTASVPQRIERCPLEPLSSWRSPAPASSIIFLVARAARSGRRSLSRSTRNVTTSASTMLCVVWGSNSA